MLISVIIPVFNKGAYLRRAVESVTSTGYAELEIVIVDDGSSDDSLNIAREIAAEHPLVVRVMRHAENRNLGVAESRNLGIRASRGELVSFLDADDWYLPNRFTCIKIFREHPDVDGVYGVARIDVSEAGDWFSSGDATFGLTNSSPLPQMLNGRYWHTSAVTVRRSLLEKTGGFPAGQKIAEDCHLWLRMVLCGKLVPTEGDEPISCYYRHDKNTYQPILDHKIDLIKTMLDVMAWARTHRVPEFDAEQFARGSRQYIVNAFVTFRESGRRDLAARLWMVCLRMQPGVLVCRPVFRQVVSFVWRDLFLRFVCGVKARISASVRDVWFARVVLTVQAPMLNRRLRGKISSSCGPQIAFVKQDVQDDLYCCAPSAAADEIVFSSLMRSGPVALFSKLHADFYVVRTEDDPECRVWREKCDECGWYDVNDLLALRQKLPGRDHGQEKFAVDPASVDWSQYDIVIGLDIVIPSRIIGMFNHVLWCYYIREPKTSSFPKSLKTPLAGYDLFFTQSFQPFPADVPSHCIHFPYYFQYPGCFDGLRDAAHSLSGERCGFFLEHHTPDFLEQGAIRQLEKIGPVRSTAMADPSCDSGFRTDQKSTMSVQERIDGLSKSRYFIQAGSPRSLFGNAAIEAVCAGALVLGNPDAHVHTFFFNRRTSVYHVNDVIKRVDFFETHPHAYEKELRRQARAVEFLCYVRPLWQLMGKMEQRMKTSVWERIE